MKNPITHVSVTTLQCSHALKGQDKREHPPMSLMAWSQSTDIQKEALEETVEEELLGGD